MTSVIWCFVFNDKPCPYTTKVIGVQWRRGSTYYSHTISYMCTTKHTPPLQESWFLNIRSLPLDVFTIYPNGIFVIHMHRYLTCLHKAKMHNFVTSLTQTSSFEWCVVRGGSRNGYQKIFFLEEIERRVGATWPFCEHKNLHSNYEFHVHTRSNILWGKWLLPWYAKRCMLVACFVS